MRILILDDDENRHGTFAHWFIDHYVCHAYTFDEFVNAILNETWDIVFLDHDLNDYGKTSIGDKGYGQVEMTGLDAASQMARIPQEKRPFQVVVHSWNPPGAANMVDLLNDMGFNVLRWEFDPRARLNING